MKKEGRVQFVAGVLVTCLVMVIMIYSRAAGSSVDELEIEKSEQEAELDKLNESMSDMAETKVVLEEYVGEIRETIKELNSQINDLEKQINQKEKAIILNEELLEKAKEEESSLYQDMKLRIQFMYEMGEVSYYSILSSGGSLAENLSRAEYISEIIAYDRSMLSKYKSTKELINTTKAKLKKDKEKLDGMKSTILSKKEYLEGKTEQYNKEIRRIARELSDSEAKKAEQEMLLLEMEIEIEV